MTGCEPWFKAPDAVRSALGAGRASAVAQAIADEPQAHTLATEVAAAKAPFDVALAALGQRHAEQAHGRTWREWLNAEAHK